MQSAMYALRWQIRKESDGMSRDELNIICFGIVTTIAVICGAIEFKMKLPSWKLLVSWTILMEVLAVLLLISRLRT